MGSEESDVTRELVSKIQQFFTHQVETNKELSEAAKESLSVATECIEQAYSIQRKPSSQELLDVYKSHKDRATSSLKQQQDSGSAERGFVSQASSSSATAAPTDNVTTSSEAPTQTSAPNRSSWSPPASGPPKVRKRASEAEKLAAESFKNQGNDYMKQDKYTDAYECYSRAIEIDNNNAVYYSNRAAASSKMGVQQAVLKDCHEAIEIDPNYSKAYGRIGHAYACMENHQKAKEAYIKALELDPNNESYRNNLRAAEEKLAERSGSVGGGAAGAEGGANMMGMLRSMMSNPEVMSMAMRSLQDPRMQNLFGLGGQQAQPQQQQPASASTQQQQQQPQQQPASESQTTNQNEQPEGAQAPANNNNNNNNNNNTNAPASAPPPSQNNQQQAAFNPADLLNMTSRLGATANIDNLVGAGQQLLSTIQQSNPELIDNMRRMMNQAFQMPPPQNQNDSDRNPPPGYS